MLYDLRVSDVKISSKGPTSSREHVHAGDRRVRGRVIEKCHRGASIVVRKLP